MTHTSYQQVGGEWKAIRCNTLPVPYADDAVWVANADAVLAARAIILLERIHEVRNVIHCNYKCGKCLKCRMPDINAFLESRKQS